MNFSTILHQSWESSPEPLDPGVPSPEDVLGEDVCTRPASSRELWSYVEALVESSPQAAVSDYGRSSGDRRLAVVTFGAASDELDPAAMASVWIGCSIHGDEPSGVDAAIAIMYRLAAGTGPESQLLRERLVIHVDPVANPDGRSRFLAQVGELAARHSSLVPDDAATVGQWPSGRGNHYLFDLNRDMVFQTQPETRARTQRMRSADPHLVLELHEMDHDDSFLFASPGEPRNPWIPRHVALWWDRLATDHGSALDQLGVAWYRGEWNEVFYPGYQDIWPAYAGGVPVILEQGRPGPVGIQFGNSRGRTYGEAVRNLVVSVFANLRTVARNAEALASDVDASVSNEAAVSAACYVVLAEADNQQRLRWLAELLVAQGLEVEVTKLKQGEVPAGSLVVSSERRREPLLHVLMEEDVEIPGDFLTAERKRLSQGQMPSLYDVTAWSPTLAAGLRARRMGRDEITTERGSYPSDGLGLCGVGPSNIQRPLLGYVFHDDGFRMVAAALEAGVTLRVTDTAIGVDGKQYHEGTVLARQDEQPRDLDLAELLERASSPHHVEVAPIVNGRVNEGPDWGSRSHRLLRRPRVGVLGCQGVDEPSFGAVRHLLDVEAGIPVAVAHPLRLARWSERLDVLIVPDLEPDAAASDVCGPTATSWLYDWVSAGGVLIAIGRGAGLPADIGLAGTTLDVAGAGWLPTGAFLEVELAPQGALTVGVTGPLPAMCQAKGRLIKGPGASVAARYSNADRLRIAGLLWPEGRDILAGTPYLVSERVGHGAVVLFSSDPIWRGASRATSRLLLRALVTQPRDL